MLSDLPSNGMHEVGFAKPDTTIQKQWIKRDFFTFGGASGNSKCQLVRFANDKIGKGVSGIKSRR